MASIWQKTKPDFPHYTKFSSVKAHIEAYEPLEKQQAEKFAKYWGCSLEKITQGAGVVGDYKVVESSEKFRRVFGERNIVEFKIDALSTKYPNLFFETESKNRYEGWHYTGHVKALIEDCILAISPRGDGQQLYFLQENITKTMMKNYREVIMPNNGGNGNWRKGRLIPLQDAFELSCYNI